MAPDLLRRRITSAKRALGILQNNLGGDLRSDALLKYQDKLQPVLSDAYYVRLKELQSHKKEFTVLPKTTLALKHTLHVPIISVTNLTVQPGEPHFILWLLISSFFPLVAACLAPLGNLISLVGLLEHWRVERATGNAVRDVRHVFALNVTSFVLGIVGNISLLINFSGKMKYLVTQSVSIFCWILAASFLLVAVLISNSNFTGHDAIYRRSEGFWLAVFTTFMYYCCSLILIINFLGYKLDKYPPTFNLDKKQRLLMAFTIAFSVWQAVGTIAMANLIPPLSYGASLYYCTVSMLTIGLGDIVPVTAGAKVFALLFSFIGVIIMGLIIATIRLVVLSSAGPSIFWHYVERRRVPLLKSLEERNVHLTTEESFRQMRLLRTKVKINQTNFSLLLSITIFLLFWLVGATIFHFTEEWGFFNSVYFCFLCLVTIGYGDFHPLSAFGRAFFVQWAIAAIPLMTILISNVGDTIYEFADRVDAIASAALNWRNWIVAFTCCSLLAGDREVENEVNQEDLEENVEVEREVHQDLDNTEVAVEEAGSGDTGHIKEARGIVEVDQDGEKAEAPFGSNISTASSASPGHPKEVQKLMLDHHRITTLIRDRQKMTSAILGRLDALQTVMLDGLEDATKIYTVDEWTEALEKLHLENDNPSNGPNYWLSDRSPLRLPIKEPNYLLLKLFFRIEDDIRLLIDLQSQALSKYGLADEKTEELSGVTVTSPPARANSASSLT